MKLLVCFFHYIKTRVFISSNNKKKGKNQSNAAIELALNVLDIYGGYSLSMAKKQSGDLSFEDMECHVNHQMQPFPSLLSPLVVGMNKPFMGAGMGAGMGGIGGKGRR